VRMTVAGAPRSSAVGRSGSAGSVRLRWGVVARAVAPALGVRPAAALGAPAYGNPAGGGAGCGGVGSFGNGIVTRPE